MSGLLRASERLSQSFGRTMVLDHLLNPGAFYLARDHTPFEASARIYDDPSLMGGGAPKPRRSCGSELDGTRKDAPPVFPFDSGCEVKLQGASRFTGSNLVHVSKSPFWAAIFVLRNGSFRFFQSQTSVPWHLLFLEDVPSRCRRRCFHHHQVANVGNLLGLGRGVVHVCP